MFLTIMGLLAVGAYLSLVENPNLLTAFCTGLVLLGAFVAIELLRRRPSRAFRRGL